MKIDLKELNKVDANIVADVIALANKVIKLDERLIAGSVQSAVLAKLFAGIYNHPTNKMPSCDKMVITYETK